MPRLALRLALVPLIALLACNRIETERAAPPEGAKPIAPGRFEPRVVASRRAEIERVTGTDEYGYPLVTADKLELLAWLRARDFEALDEALAFYQGAFAADFRREAWIHAALDAFSTAAPDLEGPLDAWSEARPESWQPALARARYRFARGLAPSARDLAAASPEQRLARMTASLERAWDDATRAVELQGDLALGHLLVGTIAATLGVSELKLAAFGNALERAPQSYVVRSAIIRGLAPRWGGTHAAMENFARGARAHLEANPKLVLLEAAVLHDRARQRLDEGDRQGALALYGRALGVGGEPSLFAERGAQYYEAGRYAEALADLERSLALRPQDPGALTARARTLEALGEGERARADVALARQLDPTCACLEGLSPRLAATR